MGVGDVKICYSANRFILPWDINRSPGLNPEQSKGLFGANFALESKWRKACPSRLFLHFSQMV